MRSARLNSVPNSFLQVIVKFNCLIYNRTNRFIVEVYFYSVRVKLDDGNRKLGSAARGKLNDESFEVEFNGLRARRN